MLVLVLVLVLEWLRLRARLRITSTIPSVAAAATGNVRAGPRSLSPVGRFRFLLSFMPRVAAGAILTSFIMATVAAAQTPAAQEPRSATGAPDSLYELGSQLFEQYATPEIKEQYEFPSREQWDAFAVRLQAALEGESIDELAAYAPEARSALNAMQALPGYEDLADWLIQRLDEIEGAQEALRSTAPAVPPSIAPTAPGRPILPSASSATSIPHYQLWLGRMRDRPVPARAAALMPRLRDAFVAEGMPPELAWIAEAESSFNPSARSPAGAKGLFQFMPETARSLGLSTFLPDDRTDPDKSAQAAARYLKMLHGRFGSWPLALAAYNAGEGRVSRTLASRGATSFAGIAGSLPAETRMYVPKVCALITMRAGVPPERIAAPR
ncbi:MAG: lytic transglycosylase domain-containing protein [Opitutus sp.]